MTCRLACWQVARADHPRALPFADESAEPIPGGGARLSVRPRDPALPVGAVQRPRSTCACLRQKQSYPDGLGACVPAPEQMRLRSARARQRTGRRSGLTRAANSPRAGGMATAFSMSQTGGSGTAGAVSHPQAPADRPGAPRNAGPRRARPDDRAWRRGSRDRWNTAGYRQR